MNKAVFLDKDGTLIRNVSYNVNPDLVEFEPYAFEALKFLQQHGFLLAIITNQPGVAFGYFTEKELEHLQTHIAKMLEKQKVLLNGFYYCPHHPEGQVDEYSIICDCSKPAPGLLIRAAKEMNIDLKQSWMIGDILNDIEAGNRAGCKTILINNGNETLWELNNAREPDYIVDHLLHAAEIIVAKKINSFFHNEFME